MYTVEVIREAGQTVDRDLTKVYNTQSRAYEYAEEQSKWFCKAMVRWRSGKTQYIVEFVNGNITQST